MTNISQKFALIVNVNCGENLETKSSISKGTGLSPRDIQYIAEKFITPYNGMDKRKRGKPLRFTKANKAEFGIVKNLLDYGITVAQVEEIFKWLRQLPEWKNLFNENGELKHQKLLSGKGRVFLSVQDADSKKTGIHFEDANIKHEFEVKNKSLLAIDITDEILMAAP